MNLISIVTRSIVFISSNERSIKSFSPRASPNSTFGSKHFFLLHFSLFNRILRTANLDGRLQLQKDRLRDEDLAALDAQLLDFASFEIDLFSRPLAQHTKQALNDAIDIDITRTSRSRHGLIGAVPMPS